MPEESTIARVLALIPEADRVHAVCHARFEADNPMFSSLRLTDGDLNVYDIERLGSTPSLVVLSACDSGFTETRAGEELTGLTTALLRMGSRTVIASVGLVPDSEATRALMVAFHATLNAGLPPARALRVGREAALDMPGGLIAAASFICVGAG
jgi:CHAT domain-containing protein